ncbi:HigA family addiction module antitoxin [Amorphus coralli]|uniref:HigA family addiction module antitoxin n=1 Tax=Amorphus coralli TaxID=340680 RepID=UPI00037F04D7|nr:HigA family addiction module antitoxin [Amorphus coralli]
MERMPLLSGLQPTHPGELLREDVLPALGRSKSDIARLLRISRQHLYDLLEERKPITPQMALRIGKLTGTTAVSWLRMQSAYDLALAEEATAAELEQIPTLAASG